VILAPGGENPVGQFPRGVEVGCLQRGEGRGKIDETAPSRAIEQTKRAGHFEATRARNGDAGPVVHENEIGVKLRGQRNGGALAIVQSGKGGMILVGDRFGDDGEPRGRCHDPVPDRFRRPWAVELVAHDGGDPHALEHPRQQIDVADQHQVVQRARIRDDDAHASETEPVQRLSVAFKFGQCHAFIDAVRLEEAVEFGAGLEPEQAAQFGSRQPAGAIFLKHERFQGAARQIGLGAEPGGQRIGNGQRDVHGGSLARRCGGRKFTHDKRSYHAPTGTEKVGQQTIAWSNQIGILSYRSCTEHQTKKDNKMRGRHMALHAVIVTTISGCTMAPSSIKVAPVSEVLNALKAQLSAIKPQSPIPANGASCSDANGTVSVVATPTKATVDLKTVTTTASDISGAANIPVSGVILSPSVGATYSNIATNEMNLTLGIQHTPPTQADILADISSVRKRISEAQTEIKELNAARDPASRSAASELQNQIKVAQGQLDSDEVQLAESTNQLVPVLHPFDAPLKQPVPATPSMPTTTAPSATDPNLTIANTLSAAVDGMLQTNHAPPCLLPQSLVVTANFQVTDKASGGFSISFLVVKLGADLSRQNDLTQSLAVTFDLSNGTATSGSGSGG